MSINENISNVSVLTNGDMSGNLISDITDTSRVNAIVFYAKWTGSPVGNIKVQVSIDNTNWVDLSDSQQPVSGANDFMWNITDTNYDKIRVVYTFTSGSGVLNIQANAKGKGV